MKWSPLEKPFKYKQTHAHVRAASDSWSLDKERFHARDVKVII